MLLLLLLLLLLLQSEFRGGWSKAEALGDRVRAVGERVREGCVRRSQRRVADKWQMDGVGASEGAGTRTERS
jgi:hypothetical protein